MNNLSIHFENKNQKTLLQLIVDEEQPAIEEVTTYLQENGEISKLALHREVYNPDTSLKAIKIFFNSQLNATIKFYRTHGEFKIKIKGL